MRLAVSAVTCRQTAIRIPSSGRSAAKRSRIWPSTGIWPAAQLIRASPAGARPGSAISDLVAIVVGLVGPVHWNADVGRLLLGELGELHPERVEVQPGHLFVEV